MVPHSENLESEHGLEPASVTSVFASLENNKMLAGIRIGLLHGRMSSKEKDEVMDQFESGQLQVLVATTVIEVGVNVPNASTMVVLDADHFGLSQLHQLRGRVGRGEHAGLCLLVSGVDPETLAFQRLDALSRISDGFELSEIDLDLRGEGDVLGDTQSGGRSSLQLLRVVRDAKLIQEVRPLAVDVEKADMSEELKLVLQIQDAGQLARG